MFTLKVENSREEMITLTQDESNYQVTNVEGLNPPQADVYTSEVALMGGQRYKSSKVQMRNIVITLRLGGEVESNRLKLYNFFGSGSKCKIYYKNDSRDVYIEGYVETVEVGLFTSKEEMQISIICPNPYFKGLVKIYTDMSNVLGLFEFEFALPASGQVFSELSELHMRNIHNSSQIPSGIKMTIVAKATVVNPIISNNRTKEYIDFNLTLYENDTLIVNTEKGHKSAVVKRANGDTEIVISNMKKGSSWFQLEVGDNVVAYSADSGEDELLFTIEHETLYEGV